MAIETLRLASLMKYTSIPATAEGGGCMSLDSGRPSGVKGRMKLAVDRRIYLHEGGTGKTKQIILSLKAREAPRPMYAVCAAC